MSDHDDADDAISEHDPDQELAERLAARGHDALVERLRDAFATAAAVHADVIQIDEARLEEVVQGYAPRADGLQWRRALATVASEELGIEVGQALHHPAVARAQELVGAPSYEDSLAALVNRPLPEPQDGGSDDGDAGHDPYGTAEHDSYWSTDAAVAEETTGDAYAGADEAAAGADEVAGGGEEAAGEYGAEPALEAPAATEPAFDEPAFEATATESPSEATGEPEPDTGDRGWGPPHGSSEPAGDDDSGADDAGEFEPIGGQSWAPTPAQEPAAEAPPAWHAPAYEPEPEPEPTAEEEHEHETFVMPAAETFAGGGGEAGAPEPAPEPVTEVDTSGTRAYSRLPRHQPETAGDQLRVTAVHLGGVANLTGSNQTVDLRLSDAGLDILRDEEEIIGRLGWSDIEALEVPNPRGLRRRRGMARAQLVVRTPSGDASFEIPAFTSEELRLRIDPLVDRFGRH